MKTNITYLLLIAALTVTFASCSSSNDEEEEDILNPEPVWLKPLLFAGDAEWAESKSHIDFQAFGNTIELRIVRYVSEEPGSGNTLYMNNFYIAQPANDNWLLPSEIALRSDEIDSLKPHVGDIIRGTAIDGEFLYFDWWPICIPRDEPRAHYAIDLRDITIVEQAKAPANP